MDYRKLNAKELDQLQIQGCTSDDWSRIVVKNGFLADHIRNVRFSGDVSLGVLTGSFELKGGIIRHSAINNVTLHNCIIGDDCLIENVQNYIANYTIGNNCFIQNVNLIVVDELSRFGNNVQVSVLNETGGREVPIFDKLSAHLAYIIALYRYRPQLIERLQKLIERYADSRASTHGTIGDGVTIINTGTIRNVRIGDRAKMDGASRLENGTINSNIYDPVFVGHNVIATDFILSSGAHVSDGAVMVRTFVGQACHLSHLFSAHDSLFFCNCQGENGEACAIFAGPYTVSMHKSSLLIAGMFSFLNAGSGSNQSNHMYKLGPIHQGIVERGSKTTSDSYILWPAKIGAFSLVMGRHVNHPDTSELPFSYLIEKNDETYLVPGVNLRSVGTIRDTQKWPKRDKRKDPNKLDFVNFNLLSPYTVSKMIRGVEVLEQLRQVSGETSAEYAYQSTHIRNGSLVKGIGFYKKAIAKFFGNSIIQRLKDLESFDDDSIRERLKPDSDIGDGRWLDIAGLIAPKASVSALLAEIESEEIDDVETIHHRFEQLHINYYEIEWSWASHQMQQWYDVDFKSITRQQIVEIINQWRESVVALDKLLYDDARKEFSLSSQVGFGVDGRESRREVDFERVRGSFEQNPFVLTVLKHIEVKSKLGDEMVAKLQGE